MEPQIGNIEGDDSTKGIDPTFVYKHDGIVTGIKFNPSKDKSANVLFISSSTDWTIKLWRRGVNTFF